LHRIGDRLAEFAEILSQAASPVLICGAAIAPGNGSNEAVASVGGARRTGVGRAGFRTHAVSLEPLALLWRIAFRHPPRLKGHNVALVIGATVFRYYPYVPGPYLPAGLAHRTFPTTQRRRAGAGRRKSHRGRSPDSCRPHGSDSGLQCLLRSMGFDPQ
jgi:hypothetical protein